MDLSVDSAKCTKCGGCVEICVAGIFEQKSSKAVPDIVSERVPYCIACGHCMMRCPTDAISHPSFSPEQIHELGRLPRAEEVGNLFRGRRSLRSFTSQKVDRSLLEEIISLAATAPSGDNAQSTEFVVVQDPEALKLVEQYTIEGLERVAKAVHNRLMRPIVKMRLGKQFNDVVKFLPAVDLLIKEQKAGKHMILRDAPVLIAFHGRSDKMGGNTNAQLCMENAMLAMTCMGLGGFYAGFVSIASQDKRLLKLLRIPPENQLFGALTVGYPKIHLTRWAERKKPQITWT